MEFRFLKTNGSILDYQKIDCQTKPNPKKQSICKSLVAILIFEFMVNAMNSLQKNFKGNV